jgi:hypothetical protein
MTRAQEHSTYEEITSQTAAWKAALERTRSASLPQAEAVALVLCTRN